MATVPESMGAPPFADAVDPGRSGLAEHPGHAGDAPVGRELDDVAPGEALGRVATLLRPGHAQPTGQHPGWARFPDPETRQGLVCRRDQVGEGGAPDDAVWYFVIGVDAVVCPALLEECSSALWLVPGPRIQRVGLLWSQHAQNLRLVLIRGKLAVRPARGPGAHDLAKDRELADVVRVVGAHDPDLPEDRVTGRVRDHREEIDGRVGDEVSQGLAIAVEARDRLVELSAGRRGLDWRPIV